jgi:hypothetical protein
MNKNLARWIMASIAQYFSSTAAALNLTYFVDGIDERTSDNMENEHVEVRINGPFVREVSHNYWNINIDLNILLTDYMDLSTENAHEISSWVGAFLVDMTKNIPIYKYGTGVDDDNSLIGCLTQRKGISQPFQINYFGQISKVDRIRQATLDGHYEMNLIL